MLTSEIVGITELSQSHWCEPQPSFAGWVSQPSCKKPISWVKNETQNWIWSFNLASNCYNLLLLSLCWLSLLHCSSGFLPSPTVHASLSTLCSRIPSLSLPSAPSFNFDHWFFRVKNGALSERKKKFEGVLLGCWLTKQVPILEYFWKSFPVCEAETVFGENKKTFQVLLCECCWVLSLFKKLTRWLCFGPSMIYITPLILCFSMNCEQTYFL